MRNRRRPPAIDPRGFLAACLAAAVILAALTGWVRTVRAQVPDFDWLLFERLTERRAQLPVPQRFSLRGHVFSIYDANADHPALLLVERRGRILQLAAAGRFSVVAFHEGSGDAPDLLLDAHDSRAGDDPAGATLHVYALRQGFSVQTIGRGDAFAGVEAGGERAVDRLVFSDRAFAGWNGSAGMAPAPGVTLVWDGRRFAADPQGGSGYAAAPRRLQRMEREMQAALAEWQARGGAYVALALRARDDALGAPPVAGWRALLGLVYQGEAAAARDLFARAWPDSLPGKREFWDDFRRHLRAGALWQALDLETALNAGLLFADAAPVTN
jgi:hypothetical protein